MPWVRNTTSDTPTEGPSVTATIVTFTGTSLLLVCLRFYVRAKIVKAVGYDDWAILVSWAIIFRPNVCIHRLISVFQLGSCGYTTCTVLQTTWGLGLKSLTDMPDENIYNFGLIQYIGAPLYVVAIYSFKLSLLLSYLRFLPGIYRIITMIATVVVTMGHIAFICVFLFLCTPIAKQWDPSITGGHCVEGVPFYLTFSSLTIIFDVTVLVLPFPALLLSKIQRRKKVVLLALFALGIFVTIIQIIRIRTIQNLKNYLDSVKPILWSLIEANIGIIIACVPTLAPLVKYFAERSRNGTSAGSQKLDSRYALQTWRSGKSGMRPLGSGVDHEIDIRAVPKPAGTSTENILAHDGITKQTQVSITRQEAPSSDESLNFIVR